MNAFERQHVDGLGDGLSIALGILERARDLAEARRSVTTALRQARAAKDADNMRQVRELIRETAASPVPA